MLNRGQMETLSGALVNLGVGLVLMGGFGPMIIQTELRFALRVVVSGSLTVGLICVLTAAVLKRDA